MRQGVDAAVGGHLGRARHGEQRIDEGHPGPEIIAENADLHLVVGVGQHGRRRDFRAGAGRGRHADQRPDRSGDIVVADVIADGAAVTEDGGHDLGQVHVAAAAEADHDVGMKHPRAFQASFGNAKRRLGFASGKRLRVDAARRQRFTQPLDDACLDEVGVADDERPLGPHSLGDVAKLQHRVTAEEQLTGGVKGPGGAHGGGLLGGRKFTCKCGVGMIPFKRS